MNSDHRQSNYKGWVLYDAQCGFCSWWVPFWRGTINGAGFDIAPLQSEWVRGRIDLSDDRINDDLRLLLHDDQTLVGAEVYLHVMKRIWWAWPLGMFFSLPGLKQLFSKAYKWFNRNRFAVSKACRMPPELPKKRDE